MAWSAMFFTGNSMLHIVKFVFLTVVSLTGGVMSDGETKDLQPVGKRKILVVDDEQQIREMFKLFVETDVPDSRVELAANGAEAVDSFMEGHHAVLLMDLHMPIMDGAEAFREIEDHCRIMDWELPAIIFCTAYDPPSSANRVLLQYEKAYLLRKPVDNTTLTDMVKNALA